MTKLMQDVRYGVRQLRKTPAFTITVLLTLALGIGANAAIFTLVNALLLKNLPVTDPRTLVRLGDDNNCCITHGVSDTGDYTYFSTDTYRRLKKNLPEFEELAAMQAGFVYQPIVVRRDGAQGSSVMGEFVSGNYFRTFGLRPRVGRLLTDSDDIEGAPLTAVMSYETWQRNYGADRSVVGSTFWVNTKPVTVVGIAPQGFYGDRLSSTPPDFYLPIEAKPVLSSSPYVHDPDAFWLYLIGRVKPGVAMIPLQEKISTQLRQGFATNKGFSSEYGKTLLARGACGAYARRRGHPEHAGGISLPPAFADVVCRPSAADCLREYCQPAAGARHGTADGDVIAHCAGSGAKQVDSPTAD